MRKADMTPDKYALHLESCRIRRSVHGSRYDENKKHRRYNFTREQYQQMLEQQGGVCVICKGDQVGGKRLAIDHDRRCCPELRSCGKCIRGLLCNPCNAKLGIVESFRERADAYLAQLERQKVA